MLVCQGTEDNIPCGLPGFLTRLQSSHVDAKTPGSPTSFGEVPCKWKDRQAPVSRTLSPQQG